MFTILKNKVDKVLKKGAVVECEQKAVEYISSIFLTEKTHGTQSLSLTWKV